MAKKVKNNKTSLWPLKLEKQIQGQAITKDSALGWVKWGKDNDYPLQLLNLYSQSPTHAACVNFAVQSIIGDGIDYSKSNLSLNPNPDYNWEVFVKNISLDYVLLGSFAIEIILNNDGSSYSFYHFPMEKVRCVPFDEDGNIGGYYICTDWTNVNKYKPQYIKKFDRDNVKRGEVYLYVYSEYSPLTDYYSSPRYISAVKAIQSEIEYITFDDKTTRNNFVPTGMLVMPEVETDEERAAVVRNIQQMFTSSDNANSIMISFRSNVEDVIPQFVPFASNEVNVNIYDSANTRTINRILTAHQVNDRQLIGMPSEGSGFNSEGALLETAYNVYNRVVGNSNRNVIVKTLNYIFDIAGLETEIVFKPLVFDINNNPTNTTESDDNQ